MKVKHYIVIGSALVLGVALFLFFGGSSRKPLDWSPTYDVRGKKPLDLYVFDQELSRLIGKDNLTRFGETPYEYLGDNIDYSVDPAGFYLSGTLMSIGRQLDEASVGELLLFAAHGNDVFISAGDIPHSLADSLGVKVHWGDPVEKSVDWTVTTSSKKDSVTFSHGIYPSYFQEYDAKRTQVLGYARRDKGPAHPNFIRVHYRQGDFYLHLEPVAFSNHALLKNPGARYAGEVLSLVPHEYVHFFTNDAGRNKDDSILRFIYNNPALRWAWNIFLIGLIVFMIFTARRKQRIVPIVKPLANTTVEFVQTIANLYAQEGDHGSLVQNKIIYFLERVRQEYRIETTTLDEAFVRRLAQKSGRSEHEVRHIVSLIGTFRRNRFSLSEEELVTFNEATEKMFS